MDISIFLAWTYRIPRPCWPTLLILGVSPFFSLNSLPWLTRGADTTASHWYMCHPADTHPRKDK